MTDSDIDWNDAIVKAIAAGDVTLFGDDLTSTETLDALINRVNLFASLSTEGRPEAERELIASAQDLAVNLEARLDEMEVAAEDLAGG